jgi:hypothetical protein
MSSLISSISYLVLTGYLRALSCSSPVNNCLLDTIWATYFWLVVWSLGTEKKIGFLKLKGLSVMKEERLSFERPFS